MDCRARDRADVLNAVSDAGRNELSASFAQLSEQAVLWGVARNECSTARTRIFYGVLRETIAIPLEQAVLWGVARNE